jgi:lipopolysaccharide biosynthesis glycosyltransferase
VIRVFIGWDGREAVAAHVLANSIRRNASMPPQFTFIDRETLRGIFTRERGDLESTDFSISRFLVPYLCNYEGFAVFMDCDILCRDDIAKLWAWRDERFALKVVKHNHQPEEETKFLGEKQTKYHRKNWSSVMLFNNSRCRALTLDYVNTAPGLDLHQFKWCADEEIGELPKQWNHLVDYDKHDPRASMVHYTKGGPYFPEFKNCGYSMEWTTERSRMLMPIFDLDKIKSES